jgi:hypothetical protein
MLLKVILDFSENPGTLLIMVQYWVQRQQRIERQAFENALRLLTISPLSFHPAVAFSGVHSIFLYLIFLHPSSLLPAISGSAHQGLLDQCLEYVLQLLSRTLLCLLATDRFKGLTFSV